VFWFVHHEEAIHPKIRREVKWRIDMPDDEPNPRMERRSSIPAGMGKVPMDRDITSKLNTGQALCYTAAAFTLFSWDDIPGFPEDENRWLKVGLTATAPDPSASAEQSQPREFDERIFSEWEDHTNHRLYVKDPGNLSVTGAEVCEALESPIDDLVFPADPFRDRDDHREVRMTDGQTEIVVARIPNSTQENPSDSGHRGWASDRISAQPLRFSNSFARARVTNRQGHPPARPRGHRPAVLAGRESSQVVSFSKKSGAGSSCGVPVAGDLQERWSVLFWYAGNYLLLEWLCAGAVYRSECVSAGRRARMTATQQASATAARVDAEIVACIYDCQPDDLLVINETARSWQVTEIVTRDCADDPADEREAKRTLRLVGAQSEGDLVAGLVLERYLDRATCRLHLLATPHWYEVESTIPVSAVRQLATQPPWVVLSRSGSADRYHRLDPVAAAHGEARPACGVETEADYRIARVTAVCPANQPCRNCMRQA
jgi:hypothetical protein